MHTTAAIGIIIMDQIAKRGLARTSAPFDGVPPYTKNEQTHFGSVQDSEKRFSDMQGDQIRSDYLQKLDEMLNSLTAMISNSERSIVRSINTPVFSSELYYDLKYLPDHEDDFHRNHLYVRNIHTRPCFAGHHFALVYIYWLINRCVKYKRRLFISDPLETSMLLASKYFPGLFGPLTDDKISECNMARAATLTPADIGIERLFTLNDDDTITLRPSAFPTAEELNSAEYVEAHNRKKQRMRARKRGAED